MKAEELRIGNWVQCKVFNKNRFWRCSSVEIRDCEHYGADWAFQPIPLTPEILEKCGFEKNVLHVGHLSFVWYGDDNIGVHGMLGMVKPITMRYVHQLQNLVHSLTQTELNIEIL